MLQAAGHPARHADLMECLPWGKIYCWPHRNVEVAFIHHGIPALADGCALHTLHAVDDGMIRPRATTTFFVLAAVLHVQVSHQGGGSHSVSHGTYQKLPRTDFLRLYFCPG